MNGRRRVVVTGLGAVTPLGNDVETSWANLLAGESGAGPITHFDHADYAVHFACELKDFDPAQWMDRKRARRMDRFIAFAVASAAMAMCDSKLPTQGDIAEEIGVLIGSGIGGLTFLGDQFHRRVRGHRDAGLLETRGERIGHLLLDVQLGDHGLPPGLSGVPAGETATDQPDDQHRDHQPSNREPLVRNDPPGLRPEAPGHGGGEEDDDQPFPYAQHPHDCSPGV